MAYTLSVTLFVSILSQEFRIRIIDERNFLTYQSQMTSKQFPDSSVFAAKIRNQAAIHLMDRGKMKAPGKFENFQITFEKHQSLDLMN